MKFTQTDNAPAAIGPYSQAVVVDGFVFCSGQIPLDPATQEPRSTFMPETWPPYSRPPGRPWDRW